MKVEYINPFIASVDELFGTMLGCPVQRGKLALAPSSTIGPEQVAALIGLSGPMRGTVVLAFPVATALKIAGRLIGEDPQEIDEEALDAVAEVVNIVAGGAKSRLSQGSGPPMDLGLPTTIVGDRYSVVPPSEASWIELPFDSELGGFLLRVAFEPNGHH